MPKNKDLIFIHIPKNAGKTITLQLGMVEANELNHYKWRTNINRGAKFLLGLSKDKKSEGRLWGTFDTTFNLAHATPSELLALGLIHTDQLKNSFTIVRDPLTRAKSIYNHVKDFLSYDSFTDFRNDFFERDFTDDHNFRSFQRRQVDFLYYIDKNYKISQIKFLKYENIISGKSCEIMGKTFDFSNSEKSVQKNKSKTLILTRQDIAWIKEYYKEDFQRLDYDI